MRFAFSAGHFLSGGVANEKQADCHIPIEPLLRMHMAQSPSTSSTTDVAQGLVEALGVHFGDEGHWIAWIVADGSDTGLGLPLLHRQPNGKPAYCQISYGKFRVTAAEIKSFR